MPVARYHRTLILPGLEGQWRLWNKDIKNYARKMGEIVQLGNLVGLNDELKDGEYRGPNLALLNYIALWRATFPQWTQLVGPNEVMCLNFPGEWTNTVATRQLRRLWFGGDHDEQYRMHTAAVNKGRLVTHGGLTHGQWVEIGRPTDANEAARLLNEKFDRQLYLGDCYSLGGTINFASNPVFADALRELYLSWLVSGEDMPFSQIHGSPGLNTIEGRGFLKSEYAEFFEECTIRYYNHGSLVSLGEKHFLNVAIEFPKNKAINHPPPPWTWYIEKMPVIDSRDEIFNRGKRLTKEAAEKSLSQ